MRPQYPDTFFLLEFPVFFTDRMRIFLASQIYLISLQAWGKLFDAIGGNTYWEFVLKLEKKLRKYIRGNTRIEARRLWYFFSFPYFWSLFKASLQIGSPPLFAAPPPTKRDGTIRPLYKVSPPLSVPATKRPLIQSVLCYKASPEQSVLWKILLKKNQKIIVIEINRLG